MIWQGRARRWVGGCVLSKATEKAGGRMTGANNPHRRTDSTTGNGDLCLTSPSSSSPPFSPAVFSRGGSWVTHSAAPFSLFPPSPFIVCWRQPPSFSGRRRKGRSDAPFLSGERRGGRPMGSLEASSVGGARTVVGESRVVVRVFFSPFLLSTLKYIFWQTEKCDLEQP